MAEHFDERFKALEAKVDSKADGERIYTMLDALAERTVTDEQERAAIVSEQDRHRKWISQLAGSTKAKLVPEQ